MKIVVLLVAGLLVMVVLAGCFPSKKEAGTAYQKISAKEARDMMDEGDVTIVDVRTAQEYAEEYIPNAINLPNEEIGKEQPEELPDQDAKLLVYCRSGRRSKEAAKKLTEAGYTKVYDFGGIIDWTYETIKGE